MLSDPCRPAFAAESFASICMFYIFVYFPGIKVSGLKSRLRVGGARKWKGNEVKVLTASDRWSILKRNKSWYKRISKIYFFPAMLISYTRYIVEDGTNTAGFFYFFISFYFRTIENKSEFNIFAFCFTSNGISVEWELSSSVLSQPSITNAHGGLNEIFQ